MYGYKMMGESWEKNHFGLENKQRPNPGILIVAQIGNDMVLETSP